MSFLDKLNNLFSQKPSSPPPLPPQAAAKQYTGPPPPPIPSVASADRQPDDAQTLRRLESALGGSDAMSNALEEGKAARMKKAQKFYVDGALQIMEGLAEDRRNAICDGLENLLIADELARQSDPNALGPWKLFHAVMRYTLEGEELEKHIFIQQLAGRSNPEMLQFMEQIDEIGPFEYIHRALEQVQQTVAAREKPGDKSSREDVSKVTEAYGRVQGGREQQEQRMQEVEQRTVQHPILGNTTFVEALKFDFLASCLADAGSQGDVSRVTEERRRQAARQHNEAYELFSQGKHQDALRGFLASIELDPTVCDAYLGAAQCCNWLRDTEQAVNHVETALAIAPRVPQVKEITFDTYAGVAQKHFEQEEWVEAVQWCRKAILICPDDANATNVFNGMWGAYERPGCYEPVLAASREIVAKCPQWNYARYRLGCMLQESKHSAEAVPVLREAVQREPTNAEYREWLIYALLGVGEGAAEELGVWEELAPQQAKQFKEKFRESWRSAGMEKLKELQATDPDKAREFLKKLGPFGLGVFDPEKSRGN